jgi:tetratricopeptide (TPR) repeat protein
MLKRIFGKKGPATEGLGSKLTTSWPFFAGGYTRDRYLALYLRSIAEHTEILEKNPNDAEAYRFRGNDYLNIAEVDLAIADWEKAIELDPTLTQYYRKMINEVKPLR